MKTICVAGKNEIAVNALNYLIKNHKDFDYCFIPNKTDQGINGWQPSLKSHANLLGVKEVSLKDVYEIEDLIFLSLEFDSIIVPSRFKSSRLFNIHFSDLPKYKGMFTSVHPILLGETTSGVSLHFIDKGIDTGDLIDKIIFPLENTDTSRELYQDYLNFSFDLFKKNIENLLADTFSFEPQTPFAGSYFSKSSVDFSNIKIDFIKTAFEIHNQIRAFSFREYQLPKFGEFEIYKSEITNEKSLEKPGKVVFEDDGHFVLSTIDFNIKLFKDHFKAFLDACEKGNLEVVKKLIGYIPNINQRNLNGWNALILSVFHNQRQVVEFLLNLPTEKRPGINYTNYKGTTVVMYALAYYQKTGDDSMLVYFNSFSPDLTLKDERGKTIFDYIESGDRAHKILGR